VYALSTFNTHFAEQNPQSAIHLFKSKRESLAASYNTLYPIDFTLMLALTTRTPECETGIACLISSARREGDSGLTSPSGPTHIYPAAVDLLCQLLLLADFSPMGERLLPAFHDVIQKVVDVRTFTEKVFEVIKIYATPELRPVWIGRAAALVGDAFRRALIVKSGEAIAVWWCQDW
jgi:hypothetical protein